jgi:Tol biopolymer transport system component
MRESTVVSLLITGIVAAACRGDVAPFESQDEGIPASHGQLTTSIGDDRAPCWSPAGDSVIYSAEGFDHLPPAPGVLVSLPREGGAALEILKNAQLPNDFGIFPWFAVPAVSPQGDRVAFVEIAPPIGLHLFCDTAVALLSCAPEREDAPLPNLYKVYLRVRGFDETGPPTDDPVLEVDVPGIIEQKIIDPSPFDPPIYHVIHNYPFQQLYSSEGAFPFRVSWAPDGGRLVFSDGLRLFIWGVGSDQATVIPGTEDGMQPAWSPDGEWIAFARFERGDSTTAACEWIGGLGPCEGHERTDYIPGRRVIGLVRPDGSALAELTEGDEPAWTPDGSRLFFRNAGWLWSVPVTGGEPVRVAGTADAREPVVSPDGQHLAFAKLSRRGDHDIWIASLEQ